MKFGPRAYAVAGIVNSTPLKQPVTADNQVHHLYQNINATIKPPGELSYAEVPMAGNEAFCVQICFRGFYGLTLNSIRDSLLLNLKLI